MKNKLKKIDVSSLQQREQQKNIAKIDLTDEFVEEHMPMVKVVAGTIVASGKLPPGITYDDLISYGIEGLIKAYQRFDKNRGVLFKTYASYRVKGEIIDKLRKEWRYRNPSGYKKVHEKIENSLEQFADNVGKSEEGIVEEKDPVQKVVANSAIVYLLSLDSMEVSSQEVGFKDSAENLMEEIEFARERAILWEEVKSLDIDEKKIVHLFYIENKKQNEISDVMGLSKSKVSRMHVKLVEKLRRRLKRRLQG
ncbi:MAG: sigma-70 family RNA polymerase sigma factor [Candidatus Margulisiibacteriota bacterium]